MAEPAGLVRAMMNEFGDRIQEAKPADPVQKIPVPGGQPADPEARQAEGLGHAEQGNGR